MSEVYYFKNKTFLKKLEDKDKYIVIACAKQENDYIVEWVEHHLNLGFDKIMIADNNDDNSLSEILKEYIDNDTVEIFDVHGETMFMSDFYNMFTLEGNYKWAAIIDCDEFIELNAYDNIKNFLRDKDAPYISFNWVMYSNDGKINKENTPIQDRFKYPLPLLNQENFSKKTIVNGSYKLNYHVHTVCSDNALFCQDLNYINGYIKHYKFKSIEEQFAIKYRGSGCMSNYVMDLYNFEEFKAYHDLLFKTIDMRHMAYISDIHKLEIKKYNVILYNIYDDNKLFEIIPIIVKDMQLVENKYFVLNYKNWKEIPSSVYNCIFEFALHTNNKICIKMPNINNMCYDYVYYDYGEKE